MASRPAGKAVTIPRVSMVPVPMGSEESARRNEERFRSQVANDLAQIREALDELTARIEAIEEALP